jgi:hypothetical protein
MVRCADCGFVGVRDQETKTLLELDQDARAKGKLPGHLLGSALLEGKVVMIGQPRCFMVAFDLLDECKNIGGENAALAVIQVERQCPSFTQWHPGYSPKEHREMLFRIEEKKLDILQREKDREAEETRRQNDRKAEETRRENDHKREELRNARDRKFQLANTLISALAGAVFGGIVAWIVGALGSK